MSPTTPTPTTTTTTTLFLFLLVQAATALPARPTTRTACLSHPTLICHLTATSRPGFPPTSITGTIRFTPMYLPFRAAHACQTLVTARVANLSSTAHGIHIHTYGDVSAGDGSSTGGHFSNPRGVQRRHGYPGSRQRHWGDLGNLRPDGSGVAVVRRVDAVIKVRGIVGRGVTVHEGRDRGPGSQPSGAAGGRVATCVIGIANPTI